MKFLEDDIYIERIRKGDLSAYSYLVDKYKNMVYTIAVKIMRNTEDAEDAAQESFIKVYQQLHNFEGKSKFSTWLYTIAYRTTISRLRKNKIDTSDISDHLTENYSPDYITPQLAEADIKDQKQHIRNAINNLPETDALIITLYYLNENSIEEISDITGLTKENIKVRLYRARLKLKDDLKFLVQYETEKI